MRIRTFTASRSVAIALVFALASSLVLPTAAAQSDPIKTAERLNKKAMEDYDLLEFDSARQTLQSALNKLREEGQDETKTAAKVYISLGMVYIAGSKDCDRGKLQFVEALKIDCHASLDPERATPELQEAFDEAKASAPRCKAGVNEPQSKDTTPPPEKEVTGGLQHNAVDEARPGQSIPLEATMGSDVQATKVIVFYRPGGVEDYQSLPMTQSSKGRFKATIPAEAVTGKALQYYIEARDSKNRPVTNAGSGASPFIVTIVQPENGEDRPRSKAEDPLAEANREAFRRNDKGRGFGRIFMNLMVGTGFGIEVEGNQFEVAYQYHSADGTRGVNAANPQGIGYFRPLTVGGTGLAIAPIHGILELGVNFSKHWALSLMGRVEGTLINNADSSTVCPDPGQSSVFGCTTKVTVAPAGMARLRYTFLEGRLKPALHLGLGGGYIRHVLDVTEAGHHLDDPPLTDAGTAQFYDMAQKDPKAVPGAPTKTTQNFVCPMYPQTCYDTIKMGYVLAAVGFNLYYDITTWRNGGFGVILDTDVIFGFGDQFGMNIDVSLGIGAHFM